MENSPTELYAQLSYGEQLTYEELLDVEVSFELLPLLSELELE